MFKAVTTFVTHLVTAIWAIVAVVMLLSAYSGHLQPETFSWAPVLGLIFPLLLAVNMVFLFIFLVINWKRAWLPIAAFVLAYPSIRLYVPLHFGPADEEGDDITLLSYNTKGFTGKAEKSSSVNENIDQFVAYLKQQQPDIVCLQESSSQQNKYVPRMDSLYAHHDVASIIHDGKNSNATAIFSHYPVLSQQHIDYPSKGNGSVAWTLKRGQDTLLVVSNHLETTHLQKDVRENYRSMLHGNETADTIRIQTRQIAGILSEQAIIRVKQARIVAAFVDSIRQKHPHWPVIVCGDFNDSPISCTYHTIAQELTDCFEEAGCGVGWTMQSRAFPVRIDHILCNDRLTPIRCDVDKTLDASDHRPIIATMRLNP